MCPETSLSADASKESRVRDGMEEATVMAHVTICTLKDPFYIKEPHKVWSWSVIHIYYVHHNASGHNTAALMRNSPD